MQHQPLQLRHLLDMLDALVLVEMREIAEHPAHGVAQLAIGVDGGLEDFRADALVVPVVAGGDPHPQDVGAGLLDHVLRRDGVAERLRHLAAVLVEREAVRDDDVEGRAAARAADFQQRGMEPAAVLVGAFQIHHGVFAAVDLALDAGELREMHRVFQHEGVGGAGIEPDVENVVDFLPAFVGELWPKEAFARAGRVPGVGAFGLESLDDAQFDFGVLQDLDRAVRLFLDEDRDRHAPGALARDHPVGAALDHAGDAVLALRRHPAGDVDGVQRARAQGVAGLVDVLVHGDEPLRRVTEDDRLLRAPGMRILVLEAAARDQHVGVDQRLDHRLVGVALLALVVDDAFSREAGRGLGEGAVLVDGIGDGGVDAARFQRGLVLHPDVEVLAAVAGRGVHKAGAGVVGNVLAGEKWNNEIVTFATQWVCALHPFQCLRTNFSDLFVRCDARLFHYLID